MASGCGGGGQENRAPMANAGPDVSTFSGVSVALDASASSDADGDTLNYAWTLSRKPDFSSATISGASVKQASFTPDIAGTYIVSLAVSDGKLTSAAATKSVTAKVPVDEFVKYNVGGSCQLTSRIFVIDDHIVYVSTVAMACDDVSGDSLFESIPTQPVCSYQINFIFHGCKDDRYTSMYKTIITHSRDANLGLDSSHKVERVY